MTSISVIIATKNGSKYIRRAVESVQKQTLSDFELIIVSDGSTDNTAEIAHELAAADPRIIVIELEKNIGPGLARNMAVEKSKSEYIAFLDDDDVWLSQEKLMRQKEYLASHPNVAVVGASRIEFFRENADGAGHHLSWLTQEVDPRKIHSNMLSYNPLVTSSAMVKKVVFQKVGGFKPMYLAEEYDLWLRIGRTSDIANIDGADTRYSIRDNSASRVQMMEMAFVVLKLGKEYRAYYPNFPKALLKAYARIALVFVKNIFK